MANDDHTIKAILFDLGSVLFVKRRNIEPDEMVDQIDCMIGSCVDDKELKMSVKARYKLDDKELEEILQKVALKYEPNIRIWPAIATLSKMYKLGIINNGFSLTLPYFTEQAPIDKYFEFFLCSGRLGIKKPDPEIYKLALKQIGYSAEECIFIDDLEENVNGAIAVGIRSMLWTGNSTVNDMIKIIEEENGK